VKAFEAQLAIVELLEHKALFTAGYKAVMHCHTVRPPVLLVSFRSPGCASVLVLVPHTQHRRIMVVIRTPS
jgi:GTPase